MKQHLKKALIFLFVFGISVLLVRYIANYETSAEEGFPQLKKYEIDRGLSGEAKKCIECHAVKNPGVVADWANSGHAHVNVSCLDCHGASAADKDISKDCDSNTKVSAVVSPKDCSRCHQAEAKEYSLSKHANTLELIWKIDPWLNNGMNNEIERATGCFTCHGTIVKFEKGKLDPMTWPNVGVGRLNTDGSKGSCSACHTKHLFSIEEARKPESCAQCHLGPDHPQIEIYMESKHGDIYTAHGDSYNWDSAPGTWTPGMDYRAPTCAGCHISGSGACSNIP